MARSGPSLTDTQWKKIAPLRPGQWSSKKEKNKYG